MQRVVSRIAAYHRRAFSLKAPKANLEEKIAGVEKAHDDYKRTILFPSTTFKRRVSIEEEANLNAHVIQESRRSRTYEWQRDNLSEPEFILHDGPPYANGPPHIGHAINKILKDIINRSHVIAGRKVHYRPGFDCHGLPIELAALKQTNSTNPEEIRRSARKVAQKATAVHTGRYQDWWVMGDWIDDGCYLTDKTEYIKEEMHCFMDMYEKGLIYRDFKPVHWSPSSGTALAESELVYNDKHISASAYVRFQMKDLPEALEQFKGKSVYALIWTTTPWTLVANQAVAFSDSLNYCLVKDASDNYYIVAQSLVDSVASQVGSLEVQETFSGKELAGANYIHPINKEVLPFLPAKHVTESEGTGLVHTAPAHGREDFLLAHENNLSIVSVVDETGCYTEAAGANFAGLEVMTAGTQKVVEILATDVLKIVPIQHRYAYDWRTNKPIIMRASYQWFIDLEPIKEKAIEAVKDIRIYPTCNERSLKNGMIAQLSLRPYWCISRQRSWGTFIPALYHKKTGEVLVNRTLVNALCERMREKGPDEWWTVPLEKMIEPEVFQEIGIDPADYEKGQDILDIWFDSGVSWSVVLKDKVADLYLEGTDQFTGWFQSSLLTSIALRDKPPYKALFAHGFAVDGEGKKMSKSLGNGVCPNVLIQGGEWEGGCPGYGIDAFRWWVASHACQHSMIPVKKELFAASHQSVNKIRAILWYLLSALAPTSYTPETTNPELQALDKYMLHCLYEFNNQMQTHYEDYAFHHASKTVLNFLPNVVSALYVTLTKHRLLYDASQSDSRRAVVEVMSHTLAVLTRSIAPIMPRLAEEVWLYHPLKINRGSIFQSRNEVEESWLNPEVKSQVEVALKVKKLLTKQFKDLSKYRVTVDASGEDFATLRRLQADETSSASDLQEIFGCVAVTLRKQESNKESQVSGSKVTEPFCPRCKKCLSTESNGLCNRCSAIVTELSARTLSL